MLPSKFHCSLIAIAAICCLPFIHSQIQWPKGVDEFDEHLINLARFKRQLSDEDSTEAPITTTTSPVFSATNAPKNSSKITKIDWNEVEANWRKVLSEDEVKAKWATMEATTKSGKSFKQTTLLSNVKKYKGITYSDNFEKLIITYEFNDVCIRKAIKTAC